MGTRTQYYDDIDPTQEATNIGVTFSLDGKDYQIDLSELNMIKLRGELGPFIEKARRAGGRARSNVVVAMRPTTPTRPATPAPAPRSDKLQNQAIRDWAKQHGFKIGEKGRIPAEVLEAYHNRDPETGRAAANETAPRTTQNDGGGNGGNEKRYAATVEEYRTALRTWAKARGNKVSSRGLGVPPPVVKKFTEETGLYPPGVDMKAG